MVFLIAYVVAHFYLLRNQERKYRHVLIDTGIYLLVLILPFFLLDFEFVVLFIGLIVSATYFFTRNLEYGLTSQKIKKLFVNKGYYVPSLFLGFHLIQILAIALTTYLLVKPSTYYYLFSHFSLSDGYVVMKWIVLILLLMKPSNLIFKTLFGNYKPNDQSEPNLNNTRKAGSKIGSLERILMVICVAVGQYTAMGLIFTAKSVARYDKITNDSEFAEYYLLGTLSSIILTLMWYLVLMVWL
jgi:hypothetical protein